MKGLGLHPPTAGPQPEEPSLGALVSNVYTVLLLSALRSTSRRWTWSLPLRLRGRGRPPTRGGASRRLGRGHAAAVGAGAQARRHSGLTWMTLTSVEPPASEVTSSRRQSSLVMMKTMEEELKVTFFLGRFPFPQGRDTTMGRTGRWTGARGRSLRLRCSQERREQSTCSRQRLNWEQPDRTPSAWSTWTLVSNQDQRSHDH